jgi:hypothetical protein
MHFRLSSQKIYGQQIRKMPHLRKVRKSQKIGKFAICGPPSLETDPMDGESVQKMYGDVVVNLKRNLNCTLHIVCAQSHVHKRKTVALAKSVPALCQALRNGSV